MIGIAGLCLIAQLVSVAHLVVVQHTRCAAHGEVIHADGHADSVDARHADAPAPAPDPDLDNDVARSAQQDGDDHDYDHCQALTERRDLRRGAAVALVAVLPTVDEAAPPARPVASAVRALYRLAPKISPPLRTA